MQRAVRDVFTPGVIAALAILLLAAAVGYVLPGAQEEGLRQEFAVRILFLTLGGWALYHGLKGGATSPASKYPRAEAAILAFGIVFFVGTIGFLLGRWTFTFPLFGRETTITTTNLAEWILIVLLMLTARPRLLDLGLKRFPQITNWILVLFIGLIGYAASVRADFTHVNEHLVDLPRRLLFIVLPAELFYRALLQTRLEYLLGPGWAILTQAVLFHLVRIPLLVFLGGMTWPLASLSLVPALVVGILAGIVWHRTRSLYLCILLHLFLIY